MKRQIPAGRFKATCLALLDEVNTSRQEIVITKRGKPVARLVPVDSAPREIFGWMKAYGGLRRTLARGLRRVQLHAYLVGAAYNLLRLARLRPLPG